MRINLLIVLFLTTAAAGPQSSHGSLRVQVITSANQPLQKAAVRVRFETSSPRRYPLEIQTTTDSSGFVSVQQLPALPVKIHLEVTGFDDYSAEVNINAGEVTTVTARLESVEELAFQRLPDEQVLKFVVACQESASSKIGANRIIFEDARKWAELWSQFKLHPPGVDFKKWRVLASIRRSNETGAAERIRRITYNPERKVTRIRFDSPPQPLIRQPAFSCDAEFVLLPPRAGELAFSFTTGRSVQR